MREALGLPGRGLLFFDEVCLGFPRYGRAYTTGPNDGEAAAVGAGPALPVEGAASGAPTLGTSPYDHASGCAWVTVPTCPAAPPENTASKLAVAPEYATEFAKRCTWLRGLPHSFVFRCIQVT